MTTINDLKTQLHGGLRKNKYQVIFSPPGDFITSEKLNILCKGSSFPERNIGVAELYHYGRKYNVRAETTYSGTWELTFYDDANMNIRRVFDYWLTYIDNSRSTDVKAPSPNAHNSKNYQRDIEIWQLNHNQEQIYGYIMHNAFPISVGVVTYDDSENDSIVEFNVIFQYSEFEPITG